MKNVLVLCSSGFIGGHLVERLIQIGCRVMGADIRAITYNCFSPDEFIQGDLRDIEFVRSIFKIEGGFDQVYQLAADMGGAIYINCGDHDGSVMSNSVTINANVAKCCIEFSAKKLFFSSSACVYPHNDNSIALCKEDSAYPAMPDNEYGWEKLFSERMYTNFHRQFGLEVRIARFHSIVGDFSVWDTDRAKAHSAIAYKIAKVPDNGTIEIIGDGSQIRTFLYVKDCVKAIIALMDSDCREPVNIGSDKPITINEYVGLLQKISGKQFNIKHIDGPTGVMYRYCDISKIKSYIDWDQTLFNEEVGKITYDWILSQMKQLSDME